jgi:RHS repeat-associated protein
LASAIEYLPFGGIKTLTYGNGLLLSQGYDNQYRISSIITGSILNLTYGYDPNGNVTSILDAINPPGGQALEFPGTYSYQQGTNKLTHIEGTPPIDYGYDSNANITTENTWTYVYDLSNQLIRVLDGANQIAEYTFNGAGQRIKKVTQTETRIFHYDLWGHIIAETNQSGQMLAEYIHLGDQLLSTIKPGELACYFHNDHLGTPQVLTDETQAVVWKAAYTPFGEAIPSIQTVDNPFRFPGQYYDQETGLHYNYFRYYNPQTGRYITPDPIGLEGGINLFSYVANAPTRLIDPWGLQAGYRGIRGLMMRLGEKRSRKAIEDFFDNWGQHVCNAANNSNIDPVMLFAILKEEMSHMLPGESFAETFLGIGETVGPGQINVDVWSQQLGADRDALTDIYTNIDAAADILGIEQQRLSQSGVAATPEMWGSRYNRSSASAVTDYGLRIGNFYNELRDYVKKKCSKKCK